MAKYRPSDKLTSEQREEIAHLSNAGILHRILADSYGVSISNVTAINRNKGKWIAEQDITTSPEERFLYAQRIYTRPSLSEKARQHIEQSVFRPLVDHLPKTPYFLEPLERLLLGVFGETDDKREQRLIRQEASRHRFVDYGVTVLKHSVGQGCYQSRDHASQKLLSTIRELEEVSLRPEERERRMGLQHKIGEVLETLTLREREIIKLRYGIADGHTYTLEEVGKIFRATRERVRQIEAKATRKLQHPFRARQLAAYTGLEYEVEESQDRSPAFSLGVVPNEETMKIPVSNLELSIRARNCLDRANVLTLGDIAALTECELLSLPHLGRTTLGELRDHLNKYGLQFKQEQVI